MKIGDWVIYHTLTETEWIGQIISMTPYSHNATIRFIMYLDRGPRLRVYERPLTRLDKKEPSKKVLIDYLTLILEAE